MDNKPSADEMPKKEVAKKAVTPKRRYFFPQHGKSIEADSYEKAVAALEEETKQVKEGDG